MGLDITAYRNLTKIATPILDGDGNPVNQEEWRAHPESIAWAEEHFPGRSEGIEPGAVYRFAKRLGFRAGSYTGYNKWRSWLAAAVDHAKGDAAGPFAELIEFADNEGVIGPVVAAKLARDFAEHQAAVAEVADDWQMDLYRLWRQAFEMAAENGAVDFH